MKKMTLLLSVLLLAGCSEAVRSMDDAFKKMDAQITGDKAQQKDKDEKIIRKKAVLVQHVDGDTTDFKVGGKISTFRYLLIDTPETRNPRTGIQPFGPEASRRTEQILRDAEKIEVEYDKGARHDDYGRELAYVYADDVMLQEILLKEGLAKVAYVIPPNTRYLERLREAEMEAKAKHLGVWGLES